MGTTLDVPVAPAINEARYNGDGAFLAWSQIDKRAVKYEITKQGQGDTQVIKNVEATQFLDRDVSMGATYTYEVVAIDKHGLASKPSSRAKITLPNE
jgi:fibronectin type 3 domain-containing protein